MTESQKQRIEEDSEDWCAIYFNEELSLKTAFKRALTAELELANTEHADLLATIEMQSKIIEELKKREKGL